MQRKIRIKSFFIIIILFGITNSFIVKAYSQWHFQNSGITTILRDIRFINKNTGWICGSDGVILKTTNSGINWINQNNEAVGKSLYGIYPLNENTVYCVGYFETILKTTNGGNNWLTIQNGPIGQGNSHFRVFFLNEMTGWIGSTFLVKKTTNGGINWIDNLYFDWMNDVYFKDSIYGIAVNGEAYHYGITTDGGSTWTSLISGQGNYYDISIMPYNKNIGFIVNASGFSVRKTTNFGLTFDSVGSIQIMQNQTLYCSKFINENTGWAGGTYGQLYKTDNGGRNWRIQNSLNESFIGKIFALNDTVVWACGGGGKIIHTTNGGDTITSIRQISTTIPDEFKLFQNYPNPFNQFTIINVQCTIKSNLIVRVFDITGREVAILANETIIPGKYEIRFDGNNLSSGIYFYSLFINGKLFQTKKMIMIK